LFQCNYLLITDDFLFPSYHLLLTSQILFQCNYLFNYVRFPVSILPSLTNKPNSVPIQSFVTYGRFQTNFRICFNVCLHESGRMILPETNTRLSYMKGKSANHPANSPHESTRFPCL